MRLFVAVALATSVLASSAFAAGTEVRAPSGTRQARNRQEGPDGRQHDHASWRAWRLSVGGIALVASEGNGTVVPATTLPPRPARPKARSVF